MDQVFVQGSQAQDICDANSERRNAVREFLVNNNKKV